MKEVSLTKEQIALVDDKDYEFVSQYKWFAVEVNDGYYAGRKSSRKLGKQKTLYMHRLIMDACYSQEVDHINGNGLDNRRENLRLCTHAENMHNRKVTSEGSSKYKGVSWHKSKKKWASRIWLNNKQIHLGYFKDEIEAAQVYNNAALKYHGDFALLNFKELNYAKKDFNSRVTKDKVDSKSRKAGTIA